MKGNTLAFVERIKEELFKISYCIQFVATGTLVYDYSCFINE